MSSKIISVFGATGQQGGSVVEALLRDHWKVRAVTRNTDSEEAKKLAAKGVSLVKGDNNDSTEQLEKLFKGCYGAFVVTAGWDPDTMGREKEQGINLANAAKKQGVQHFVYSTLANGGKISGGKYHVPHFSDKAAAADHIRKMGFPTVTFFQPAFYYQNLQTFFPPKTEHDGSLVFTIPSTSSITMFDVNDTGPVVAAIFKDPKATNGKEINPIGLHASPTDIFKTLEKVSGKKVKLIQMPRDQFSKLGTPSAEKLADMFGWFDEFTYYGPEADLESGKKLYPNLVSFESWVKDNKW